MQKTFRIDVFGKPGCDKCHTLNKRLDKLIGTDKWSEFEKCYRDLMTADGLVDFCASECINPQRIPAFIVKQWDAEAQAYQPVPNPSPGVKRDPFGDALLFQHLGLQTDYSEAGRGVLSRAAIEACLEEAAEQGERTAPSEEQHATAA